MVLFGKRKEKSLEELAKEEGLILNKGVPPVGCDDFQVKGFGYSHEEAKRHLCKNAKTCGAKYISFDIGEPRRRTTIKGSLYTYITTAYRPIEPAEPAA